MNTNNKLQLEALNTEELNTEQLNELLNGFASHIAYQIGEYVPEEPPKAQTYVWQEDGIYSVRETKLARFVIHVTKTKEKFPDLGNNLKEGCSLKIPRKIPFLMFENLLNFFKYFYKNVMQTEVYVRIFYSPSKDEFYFNVPKQYVSSVRAKWDDSDENISQEDILVLQCHSHHNMNGAFSSIDDKDHQTLESFHLVIGNIFDRKPSWQLRFALMDKKINLNLDALFEVPKEIDDFPLDQFGDFKTRVQPISFAQKTDSNNFETFLRGRDINNKKYNKNKNNKNKNSNLNLEAAKLTMANPSFVDFESSYPFDRNSMERVDIPVTRGYFDDESYEF